MWRQNRLWWRKRRSVLSNCSSQAWIFEGEYFLCSLPLPTNLAKSIHHVVVDWFRLRISGILISNNLTGQTTTTPGGGKPCEDPCQCWHKENSHNQRGWSMEYGHCFGIHLLGGRHFWNSAEHRTWVERPTFEGVQLFHLITQNQISAPQPPTTYSREHIDGGRKEQHLDSLHYLC